MDTLPVSQPAKPEPPDDRSFYRRWLDELRPARRSPAFWLGIVRVLLVWGGLPVLILGSTFLLWLGSYDFSETPVADADKSARQWLAERPWEHWCIAALVVALLSIATRAAFLAWRAERDSKAAATERARLESELARAAQVARDMSPEKRVRCEHEWKIEDGIDPPTRLGVATHIFNANAYPVTFRLVNGEVIYGDRLTKNIEIEGIDDEIWALNRGWIYVWIKLDGALGDEIRADLAAGTLKSIDMRKLVIAVCDGQRQGRLALPDGVRLVRKESWTVDYPVFDFLVTGDIVRHA